MAFNNTLSFHGLTSGIIQRPAPKLKKLLVYYGFPVAYKGIWSAAGVIAELTANFDYWIVGHTYQDPAHEEYASTMAIMRACRAAGMKIYGYIPLGTSSYNYSIAQMTTITDQWMTIGVDGIFIDEYGFDYGNTRQRQIDMVNMVHSKGLPICANSWVMEEFVSDTLAETGWTAGDWRYDRWVQWNPTNLPSPKMPGDSYMFENFCYDNLGPTVVWDTQERGLLASALAKQKNVSIWALAVFGETTPGTLDVAKLGNLGTLDKAGDYITANAFLYDMPVVGSGGFSFGSNGTPLWAPLKQLPAIATAPTELAANDYTAMTGIRYFGKVKITVTNTATVQSVEVINSTPSTLGQSSGSGSEISLVSGTAGKLAAYTGPKALGEATYFDTPAIAKPAAPATDNLRWFARNRAGRALPHVLGPNATDVALQPALFGSSVYMWLPGAAATVSIAFGTTFTARNTGTSAAQAHPTKASTNALTSMTRATFTTGTTATGSSGIQSTATVAWRGNAANLGGFFFFARFGVEVLTSDIRVLVGLSSTNAAITTDPSTINNTIALTKDAADTTWQITARSGSATTKTNTGITITQGQILDFTLFAPPNAAFIGARVSNPLTGEILFETNLTANLPANNVFMYMHAQIMSTVTTTSKTLALNRMYCETDL